MAKAAGTNSDESLWALRRETFGQTGIDQSHRHASGLTLCDQIRPNFGFNLTQTLGLKWRKKRRIIQLMS